MWFHGRSAHRLRTVGLGCGDYHRRCTGSGARTYSHHSNFFIGIGDNRVDDDPSTGDIDNCHACNDSHDREGNHHDIAVCHYHHRTNSDFRN